MDAEGLDAIERFGRYHDVDGDNIPWRTLPGTHPEKGAFFTRGTSRDEFAIYSEKGADYQKNMERLLAKWQSAPEYLPKPEVNSSQQAMGIIHYGTSACAVEEAIESLHSDGMTLDSLRIRAVPFHTDVSEFIDTHEKIFVVEQNRDGQMRSVLINELNCSPEKLVSVVHYNGDPISAGNVIDGILRALGQVDTDKNNHSTGAAS